MAWNSTNLNYYLTLNSRSLFKLSNVIDFYCGFGYLRLTQSEVRNYPSVQLSINWLLKTMKKYTINLNSIISESFELNNLRYESSYDHISIGLSFRVL